jgi:phosphohistidine phosphatase
MNLYLLRHGLAVDRGASGYARDSDRVLTPKGERRLWQTAEAMEALEITFDVILSSPYARARQTAEIVAEAFKAHKKLQFSESLTPGGDFKELVALINRSRPRPEDVLLVGHEPHLSGFISLLVSSDMRCSIAMKKGGVCKLEVATLKPGRCATLEWLLTPRQMALMA